MTRAQRRLQAAINAQRHRQQREGVAAAVAAEVAAWDAQPHDYDELHEAYHDLYAVAVDPSDWDALREEMEGEPDE